MIKLMTDRGEVDQYEDIGKYLKNIDDYQWVWVDFLAPNKEEIAILSDVFHFHPLAIEDCLHYLQRPKLDYYDGYNFYVLHSLNQETLDSEEVDLFVSERFLVTFHQEPVVEIEEVWNSILVSRQVNSPAQLLYFIFDKIVDMYFPAAYQIEDALNDLEDELEDRVKGDLIDQIFDMRKDLIKLRRSFQSTRELVYRMLNSERLQEVKERKVYFNDIYDHLIRLTEIIDSSREMTADMRDSYFSLNSNRMNSIMMTLTVISSIFIPLTFIVGVYGMNFDNMPELHWHFGYYGIMICMLVIAVGMITWFIKKGWFKS
ncbi:magnesium transporter [Pullulanibacillus pueri]|uniref:Magnesium transport protein CorA n=1 Tax=Pullulanibacillus pueri TaxID=1437324 RepID=A0A8J3EM92_9BACL|nr:magnesium/cobalt transporter CorA [Pullulanibacillus pueri]MBM7682411.1 magnesium transporter [Pullulanibacillus pueri]GGH81745.1 putative metal ion transporter YfjQ [Pullulanibacillus pueri]